MEILFSMEDIENAIKHYAIYHAGGLQCLNVNSVEDIEIKGYLPQNIIVLERRKK